MKPIDRLFRRKITELALCANGPGVVLDREGVKGGERLNLPNAYGSRVFEFYGRYRGARSDTIRLRIIAELQDELRRNKITPHRDYYPGTLEFKVMVTRDRRSEFTVAYAYGVSPKTVKAARQEVRERIMAALEADDSTVRGVAAAFGMSKSTVGRMAA